MTELCHTQDVQLGMWVECVMPDARYSHLHGLVGVIEAYDPYFKQVRVRVQGGYVFDGQHEEFMYLAPSEYKITNARVNLQEVPDIMGRDV